MFGFLKKKKENQLSGVLKLGNAEYGNFVKDLFDGLDNATKAHVLVAYQNLLPIVSAMHNVAKREGSAYSIDDLIIECANHHAAATDEVNSRRWAWFMWAALVYRLVTMAVRDVDLQDMLADIWCDIARCAPFLKVLLPHNVVWNADEKVWFELMLNDPEPGMIAWAINHGGPKVIWKSAAVRKLAIEHDLFYSEHAQTWGPVSYIPPRGAPGQ